MDADKAELDAKAKEEEQRSANGRKPMKSKADEVIAIPYGAIELASKMWRKMLTTHAGPSDLKNFIRMTRGAFTDLLKENFYELRNAPDKFLMQIYAMGVRKAETHTTKEIEKAFGFPLPEDD